MAYNAPRYFAPAYFGGAADSPVQIVDLAATLDGYSFFSAGLVVDDNTPQQQIPRGFVFWPQRPPVKVIDLSARLRGSSRMTAHLTVDVHTSARLGGQSAVMASAVIGFNFAKHRRRQNEQAAIAWLLAA